jgi:hypothetical protein
MGRAVRTLGASTRAKAAGAVAALALLALMSGKASPGFALARVPAAVTRTVLRALHAAPAPAASSSALAGMLPSAYALADVPADYLRLYIRASGSCRRLTWQILAGIGKVESDHGRSPEPGVRDGVNSFGCCAGPMQFNVANGPPSTWDAWGDGVRGHVYDPAHAIPATARMLCADGLGDEGGSDPCPQVLGTAPLHRALMAYNHACWYAHEVVTIAARYTLSAPAPAGDPFVQALAANPRIQTTRSRGCDPAADLASGRLDLRVQSILAALSERWRIRVSCLRTGHSYFVKGTTRVSNHTVGRAVDIDMVDGQPVGPGSLAARSLVTWLDLLEGPLRPAEVGSPFDLGHRPYFTDEGHQEHVHIGYGPW